MSTKAMAWAKAHGEAETRFRELDSARIEWCCPHGGCHAKVSARGEMVMVVSDHNHATLEPEAALALARWILDTFGEAP